MTTYSNPGTLQQDYGQVDPEKMTRDTYEMWSQVKLQLEVNKKKERDERKKEDDENKEEQQKKEIEISLEEVKLDK